MVAVIGSALVLGILIPAIIQGVRKAVTALDSFLAAHLPGLDLAAIFQALDLSRYLVSAIVLFYAFTMLYKLAPRRKVRLSEVWLPALVVTLLLQIVQVGFVSILPRFINYSSIYGSIGGLMLLLFWIYITGQIIILGGCLSATIAKVTGDLPEKSSPR
jgi:membrane protein